MRSIDRALDLSHKESFLSPETVIWGFPGFHGKGVIINARVEAVAEKPMFRNCLATRRCIIPSTCFYEWSHDDQKTKYQSNLPGASALYMAGLYNEFQGENRFVIFTTAANTSMADVHNRILDRDRMERWKGSEKAAVELLTEMPPELDRITA